MSLTFRWLSHLLGLFRRSDDVDGGWVEPSNAITRAVMSGSMSGLSLSVPEPEPAEVVAIPEREQPTTRTAQRTRRRRASRAA
ncbi:MAG: hypothetical protein AB7N24_18480 [Dehalococcoidia bacterium]